MPKRPSLTQAPETKNPIGGFISDGSWVADAGGLHLGVVNKLARVMLVDRRAGTLTPEAVADAAEAASCERAFPNRSQWREVKSWPLLQCSTSIESMLKYEGRGSTGHWCGERYAPGKQADCTDERHRPTEAPVDAVKMLSGLVPGIGP
jgi:hypothetical protein